MPFVLPPNVAIGSQEAIYLRAIYESQQTAQAALIREAPLTPLGYQQISNANLAAAMPLAVPSGATIADVENNGSQPCRWRDDGVDPTPEQGRVIPGGETRRFNGNLATLKLIRAGDGVTLDVSFYKPGA